jgi:hypothetical protein
MFVNYCIKIYALKAQNVQGKQKIQYFGGLNISSRTSCSAGLLTAWAICATFLTAIELIYAQRTCHYFDENCFSLLFLGQEIIF